MEASTGNQPGRENLKGAGNLPGHVDFFPFLLDFLWTVAFFLIFLCEAVPFFEPAREAVLFILREQIEVLFVLYTTNV